jgi:acyl dehydratase
MTKYFEDHVVGETGRAGPYPVSRDEVMDFAATFARPTPPSDPAKPLKTSGAHYLGIYQRLQIDPAVADGSASALITAVGIEDLRWQAPLHSGDVLHLDAEVLEKTESATKPDRGVIRTRYTLSNQRDDVVLTLTSAMLMRRRPNS